MRGDKDVVAKAIEERRRAQEEGGILARMAAADRNIRKSPVPSRRGRPRVTRYESPRQRAAMGQTKNSIRAIYQSPSQARSGSQTIDPAKTNLTREVGPNDNGTNYCHGKETESRG